MRKCALYVCQLYGVESENVNEARYQLFVTKSGATQQLPPCQSSLKEHTKRANYVTAIWKRAHLNLIKAPSPVGHGWCDSEGGLTVQWHDGVVAPKEALQDVACRCQKSKCVDNKCRCKSYNLKCTDLCQCTDCSNCGDDDIVVGECYSDSDEDE